MTSPVTSPRTGPGIGPATGRLRTLLRLAVVLAVAVGFLTATTSPGTSDSGEGAVVATAKSQRLVSLGMQHSCAITNAGTVQCWGDNASGQLGTGDLFTSTSPRLVAGVTGAVELAAGNSHTCVLIHGGSVRCWGLNGSGQLGVGNFADSSTPLTVPGLSGVTHLAAGGFHTCALLTGGTVKCWGQDGSGQLGDGSPGDFSSTPQAVTGLPVGDPVVDLTAGESHTCAVTDAGKLWCWGHNGFGQLGNNTLVTSAVPVPVGAPGDPTTPMGDVLAVSAGGGHTCAILGLLNRPTYCWGQNSFGQLGHETTVVSSVMEPSKVPLRVQIDADTTVLGVDIQPMNLATAVSAGQEHTCALIGPAGAVRCWGQNGAGQLGFDWNTLTDKKPTNSTYAGLVPGLNAQAVVAGGFHTCALDSGQAKCWGYNFFGQLGHYTDQVPTPTTVTAVRGASKVAVATHAACVLVSDVPGGATSAQCWGDNTNGRLGIDSFSPLSTTVRRPVVSLGTATGLRAGNGTFCAVPTNADRKCWGLNGSGEIGDNTTSDRKAPVTSTHLAGVTAYDLGGTLVGGVERGTTCKVAGGNARCWGYNGQGQLGDNTTTNSTAPVTVRYDDDPDPAPDHVHLVDLPGVTQVAVGGDHACAIVGGGQVRCWGANGAGQLGDNTTTARPGAVLVQQDTDPDPDADDPLTGAAALVAGNSHTCALLTSGKVRCWGLNSAGQLGHPGGGQQADQPVKAASPAGDLANVTLLVSGDNHNCALRAGTVDPDNQSLVCWGANDENQLGVGGGNNSVAQVVLETPTPDDPLPGPWIADVSAGRDNTCAVLLDTTVSCWGDNSAGQIGDGVGTKSLSPLLVGGGAAYDTNQIPLPQDLTVSTTPGTPVDIAVPLAGVDPDAGPVTIVAVGDPPLGTATFLGGTITYTPDAGCHDDTFAYVVTDGIAQVAAQVTVLMNCAPVALADTAATAEDTAVLVDVLANDSDEDGDPLTISTSFPVSPAHGAVLVVSGKVRYTPAADFCGPPTDTFTYEISDGHGHTASASVVVTVTCGPDGPTAGTDGASTPEDTSVVISVLANDGDVDGDSLTVTSVGNPAHGTTSTNGTTVTYLPASNYCGLDSFTYVVSDGALASTGTVNVSVICVGDSPHANADTATVVEDGSVLVDVLANDTDPEGDPLTLTALGAPVHGTVAIESGQVRYTPTHDYCGPDTFTYTVGDPTLTAVGTVTISVTCVNDTPVAVPDAATTNEDTNVHVHVITNDIDVDGNPLHVGTITDPPHGTAGPAQPDAIVYTPDPNFCGTDMFDYQVVDTVGASSTTTVTVTVLCVDDPVQLAAITDRTTAWGDAVAVPLVATDPDAQPITFSLVSGPAGASVSGSAFSWTPSSTQVGSFLVKVRASSGGANADRTFTVVVSKRATTLVYDGPTSGQLSDGGNLHATLRDAANSTAVTGRSVGFVLGPATASATTAGDGGATATISLIGTPGVRTLQTSFAGDGAWTASSTSTPYTVTKEAYSVALGGTLLVSTAASAATVTYTADLAEESDGTFAGQLGGTPVTFKRLDGTTLCSATASNTVPGQARATCTATQAVGALPVVVTATSGAYAGPAAVGVVTVANPGSGFASGAGRASGDAFGFQVRPVKKGAPTGNAVHVVVGGGVAKVVAATTIGSLTTSCGGKPSVCQATIQAPTTTVTQVDLTTGAVTTLGSSALRIDATAPNRYAVAVTGSVTRSIGTPTAQVVIDTGSVVVG